MTRSANTARRRFAPGRPERRAKFMKRRGVVRAQFRYRSQRIWRKIIVVVSGTCLWLSWILL